MNTPLFRALRSEPRPWRPLAKVCAGVILLALVPMFIDINDGNTGAAFWVAAIAAATAGGVWFLTRRTEG